MSLSDLLGLLSAEPVTLARLAARAGVTRREAEQAVQEMRLAGHPIVSDGAGVRLARGATDALTCADRLRRRALGQLLTARALRRAGYRMADEEASRRRLTLWDAA